MKKFVSKKKILTEFFTMIIAIFGSLLILNISSSVQSIDYDVFEDTSLIAKSLLQEDTQKSIDNVNNVKNNLGGVALGVCQASYDPYSLELINDANIGWTRLDIYDFPYLINVDGTPLLDKKGNYIETESYKIFKEKCKTFQDNGIKVMAITYYPSFVFKALDNASTKDEDSYYYNIFLYGGELPIEFDTAVKGFSEYIAADLTGNNKQSYQYVSCFQISNELTQPRWKGGLTTEQVAYYIGELQMKSMYEITSTNHVPIGYNTSGTDLISLPEAMNEYSDYFDYVGLDLYLGCFESIFKSINMFTILSRYLYKYTEKPVIFTEFGYISSGSPKTETEKAEYLKEKFPLHPTVEAIKSDTIGFLDEWESILGEESSLINEARRRYKVAINNGEGEDAANKAASDYIFSTGVVSHLYESLPSGYELSSYKHTEEGQANFYKDTIETLSNLDYVCGMFCYCFSDSNACYECSQSDCPVETSWGLVRFNDELDINESTVYLKASYYAVKEAFGKIVE